MEELALHILDIVQNSVRAGAKLIKVHVMEDTAADRELDKPFGRI